jgi:ComF family protein
VLAWWNAVVELVYPPVCCHCRAATAGDDFCSDCADRIEWARSPACSHCGVPFRTHGGSDHTCGRCVADPPVFGRARAAAIYDASEPADQPLKSVLQRYKYNRDVGLAAPLARLLEQRNPFDIAEYDVLMPVPLHLSRLRWRGFNQALLLARRIARTRGASVDPFSLERTRATQPQVELDEQERRRNVARAFRVSRPAQVRDRRILLVDDVYTTGSTVDECSRVLLKAGARSVDVLVLARAVIG